MEILISIFGAVVAIIVAVIGAILSNKNSNLLQLRKLKEQHYICYIESLHNFAATGSSEDAVKFVYSRDKLFIVASEEVVRRILEFEEKGVGQESEIHDKYLTEVIKAIRMDLKLKDENFPTISFKK